MELTCVATGGASRKELMLSELEAKADEDSGVEIGVDIGVGGDENTTEEGGGSEEEVELGVIVSCDWETMFTSLC